MKLNAEVIGEGPAKAFPDRTWFLNNIWYNTRFIRNAAPHNILNIDGGVNHVVRGNLFADYIVPADLRRPASAVYPKASTRGMLIEQNLIICERTRTEGETARGILLGDGAPATSCDGDNDGDGVGDCEENGQNQEAIVRNNIIMNCNNGGSSGGIMVSSDRASVVVNNTVVYAAPRSAVFYVGHPNFDTLFRGNILENGFDTNFAQRPLNEMDNLTPNRDAVDMLFTQPQMGDFSVENIEAVQNFERHPRARYDFCGGVRQQTTSMGATEYVSPDGGAACVERVRELFNRIPND